MDTTHSFQWERRDGVRSPYSLPVYFGVRAVLVGQYIFVLGNNSKEQQPFGHILDIKEKAWKQMPANTCELDLESHSSALYNDTILLLGVFQRANGLIFDLPPKAFTIDLTTLETEMLATYGQQPSTCRNSANVYEEGNQLILFGGIIGAAGAATNGLSVLSLENMLWKTVDTKGEKPPALELPCACIANHTLVVCTGYSNLSNGSAVYTIRLDQQQHVWHVVRPAGYDLFAEENLCCFSVGSGKILVYRASLRRFHILERFSSKSPLWNRVLPGADYARNIQFLDMYHVHGSPPPCNLGMGAVQARDKIILPSADKSEFYTFSAM